MLLLGQKPIVGVEAGDEGAILRRIDLIDRSLDSVTHQIEQIRLGLVIVVVPMVDGFGDKPICGVVVPAIGDTRNSLYQIVKEQKAIWL